MNLFVIFVADVEIQSTDTSDNLNSFFHLNHHHDHPIFDKQNKSMPFGDHSDNDDEDNDNDYNEDYRNAINCVVLRKHKNRPNEDAYDKIIPRIRPLSAYSETTSVPRIVITPTPEDDENRRASWAFPDDFNKQKISKPFETFELLSSKLSQFYASNNSSHDQNANKILTNSQELGDDSSSSEDDSDSESQSDEVNFRFERSLEPPQKPNDNLKENEGIHDEHHHDSDDDSADIIEFIIDNSGDQASNCDTVEFNDHLSVIFEEDERSQHSKRMPLESMYSSNSSATLENDDSGKHFESDAESDCDKTYSDNNENDSSNDTDDDTDDQSTSVTVRLPLRLSFSRSDNDEEITTVMVGKMESEIKVDDMNDSSNKASTVPDSCDSPDVSVSICLRPKSRPTSICTQTSIESSNNKSIDCDDDSDAEVSVSISLPLRQRTKSPPPSASSSRPPVTTRPTFTRQQTLSPVPRSHDEFEYKVWNRGFSIERETSIAKSIKPKQMQQETDDTMMSFHDRIAAFESFSPKKKEELQRQNACDMSVDETQNEKDNDEAFNVKNLPQSTKYRDYCDRNDETKMEPSKPQYESYVTSQCNTYNLEPEPAPEYFDSNQHFNHDEIHPIEKSENNGEEEEVEDYKANLSVQQKIAAFEKPSTNQLPKTDAHQEICMAREKSNQESIGNRFLAKISDSHQQTYNDNTNDSDIKLHSPNAAMPNKIANCMYLAPFEESELDETDSGVDIHRRVSEDVDTESECYSELRKLTRYERAATHSRLFKILQEYENELNDAEKTKTEDELLMSVCRPKKIVHNVSITRRQNPELAKQAETMAERRERLHLNYNSSSIDNDNASSSASPSCASPTSLVSVNEKLIDELVHSVLQQTKRRNLQHIPIEKIQAAARRALIQQHEENDSCDTFSSFDSTPAMTPHEFNDDCYDSDCDRNTDIFPSKAFKHLQEQSISGRRYKSWAARCPRVLSSKTVNSDLSRVTETRESQSPEREHQYIYQY